VLEKEINDIQTNETMFEILEQIFQVMFLLNLKKKEFQLFQFVKLLLRIL
jgi:hypothetical protein